MYLNLMSNCAYIDETLLTRQFTNIWYLTISKISVIYNGDTIVVCKKIRNRRMIIWYKSGDYEKKKNWCHAQEGCCEARDNDFIC